MTCHSTRAQPWPAALAPLSMPLSALDSRALIPSLSLDRDRSGPAPYPRNSAVIVRSSEALRSGLVTPVMSHALFLNTTRLLASVMSSCAV